MMNNELMKLFFEIDSNIELGMSIDIQTFWKERKDVINYDIQFEQAGKVLINVILHNFSKSAAKKIFLEFVGFVGYEGINFYMCENLNTSIRYLYFTGISQFNGVKMEITIK